MKHFNAAVNFVPGDLIKSTTESRWMYNSVGENWLIGIRGDHFTGGLCLGVCQVPRGDKILLVLDSKTCRICWIYDDGELSKAN